MAAIQQDRSPEAMVRAIEANTEAFLLELGLAGGGDQLDEPGLGWVIGGSPIDYHNAVFRADLAPGAADDAIRRSLDALQAKGVPGSWHVGPSMQPADLGERLERHGFAFGGEEAGMAIDLERLSSAMPPVPAGLTVERVVIPGDLATWIHTLGLGFGAGPHEAEWTGEMYAKLGYQPGGAWHHYLARLDGDPVATTTLYLGAGVAGIYFVFTREDRRRLGIGAAITWKALDDARTLGYRIGVLGASPMGAPVYRALGFEEYCRIAIYEWARAP